MKTWIPMLIISISVVALCVWDGIHTNKVFNYMQNESQAISTQLETTSVLDADLSARIENLNDYWTKKMDILCISISRKDLQPISDYLQYMCASITNEKQEDAITYSRLLNYNLIGLYQTNSISFVNLL